MPRGKKYDAAEKHFLKQKEVLDKRCLSLSKQCAEYGREVRELSKQLKGVQAENEKLRRELDALKELHGLSDSDVRTLIRQAEDRNMVTGMLKHLGGYY